MHGRPGAKMKSFTPMSNNSRKRPKRKILLTGASGRLGTAIRECADDIELVCVDLSNAGDPSIHKATFTDVALMETLLNGCDAVIHTAGLHGGNRKTHSATQYIDINVGGTVGLLELCSKLGVKRFIFSSTMEVLLGHDLAASGMSVVDEKTTPNPNWIYPASKLSCEQLGEYYHRHRGLDFVALRYQGFEDSKPSHHLLARRIMTRDVAKANLLAATVPDIGYQVINIGCNTPIAQLDIVRAVTDPQGVIEKHWPGSTAFLQANGVTLQTKDFWPVTRIDHARRVLGWRPEVDFADYLHTIGWRAQSTTV